MLTPVALEQFGFKLDDFSRSEREIFRDCDDDVERCTDAKRWELNAVFSRYFD